MIDKKLKIAIFHNLGAGGAVKVLRDHITHFKEKGHMVDVYVLETADDEFAPISNIADNFYKVPLSKNVFKNFFINLFNKLPLNYNIPEKSKFYYTDSNIKKTYKKLANTIDKKGYDVILSEQDSIFVFSPYLFQYIKTPLVYYCQQPFRADEKILDVFKSFIEQGFLHKLTLPVTSYSDRKHLKKDAENAFYADYILANSYFSHENILRRYGKSSLVSYLGINNEFFKPLNNIQCENFILSVGNLSPHKGFDFIINSLSNIPKSERPDFVVVGYGEGHWENYLKDLAKEKDVNLKILNGISDEELLELYNKAKLFVFASYLEPFGLVTLEAMACGTPVVVVNEGGIREIVKHGENGFLIQRDEKMFADAISELLNNQKLYEKFSKKGIEEVSNFWTTEKAANRLLDNLNYAIEKENRKK